MANWDVFHGDRLEVERALSTAAVRQALARGDLRDDDLIRPAGTTTPWARIADFPALHEPEPPAEPPPPPPTPTYLAPTEVADRPVFAEFDDEDDDLQAVDAIIDDEDEDEAEPEAAFPAADVDLGRDDLNLAEQESIVALPVGAMASDEPDEEEYDPQEEDEAAAEFTLSRGAGEKVEELDLAAMVDVAFQLVLFFLVTATTVLYKSLEVPKPNPESPAAAAAQGRSRTIDDLKNDYIVLEIDPAGSMQIDHEPVAPNMSALIERLRTAREKTGRKAMLLTADFATPHRNAVLAYDAANEIGLNIAIARPSGPGPGAPAPSPPAAKKTAGG